MNHPLYPLSFQPLFQVKPWGGNKLARLLGKPADPHLKVGESWEISDRGKDSTPVAGGPYRGKTLHELISLLENRLLGDLVWARRPARFPLLYKILDVEAVLSVQVHPGEEYAREHAGEGGKPEMWYVLQADRGAGVVCGLKTGVTRRRFREAVRNGHVEKTLCEYPACSGESYFIAPGQVHTIIPSCLIIEIQANSDVTYRIYDWGRTGADGSPRELHVEHALKVIDFGQGQSPLIEPVGETRGKNRESLLASCPEFTVEKLELAEPYADACRGRRFQVLTALEGRGKIEAVSRPGEAWDLRAGDFCLLPAYLGEYRVLPAGRLSYLKSYPTIN